MLKLIPSKSVLHDFLGKKINNLNYLLLPNLATCIQIGLLRPIRVKIEFSTTLRSQNAKFQYSRPRAKNLGVAARISPTLAEALPW